MNSLFDLPLSKEDNLLKKFEEIHNYIYANDGLSTQQTLEKFVKILFIKIFDENRGGHQFTIFAEEWNELKQGKTANSFIERIQTLFTQTQKVYQDIFDDNDRVRLSAIALGFTVNKLQQISFAESAQDVKGLAFQKFLSHHEKDSRGQFLHPNLLLIFALRWCNRNRTRRLLTLLAVAAVFWCRL